MNKSESRLLLKGLNLAMTNPNAISITTPDISFGHSTIALSKRLKNQTFKAILSQDVSFFDAKDHSIGSLCNLLNTSTEDLVSLGGPTVGGILTFVAIILAGILIAFANA
ncbi:hypothetical protein E4T39_02785 [Aureobasidium subglaciale]|nr:hypothetical protein E4T39_02785 [Aureobasidium subglaciale]